MQMQFRVNFAWIFTSRDTFINYIYAIDSMHSATLQCIISNALSPMYYLQCIISNTLSPIYYLKYIISNISSLQHFLARLAWCSSVVNCNSVCQVETFKRHCRVLHHWNTINRFVCWVTIFFVIVIVVGRTCSDFKLKERFV